MEIELLHTILRENDHGKLKTILKRGHVVSQLYPPAKNSNKFLYGKLCEMVFLNEFEGAIDLDTLFRNCSFKDDMLFKDCKFSIKTSMSNGNFNLINKRNRPHYDYHTNLIIIKLDQNAIYIFPTSIIPEEFIIETGAEISLKNSFIRYIDTNFPSYVSKLPKQPEPKFHKSIDFYQVAFDHLLNITQ